MDPSSGFRGAHKVVSHQAIDLSRMCPVTFFVNASERSAVDNPAIELELLDVPLEREFVVAAFILFLRSTNNCGCVKLVPPGER